MRLAVLDPRNCDLTANLFILDGNGQVEHQVPLGYVPEVRFHAPTRELVILDSDVSSSPPSYHLKVLDADSLEQKLERAIPVRPMYAGFPGRAVGGSVSSSGRYVYFIESGEVVILPEDLTFRLTAARYDRLADRVELGEFRVASCHVSFGVVDNSEESLFFHLSCDYPSTIALGEFHSAECRFLSMVEIGTREHGPDETIGSWLTPDRRLLYCVNRRGAIYQVNLQAAEARMLAVLPLSPDTCIPMHQIYGADGHIHVGVARSDEAGAGLVSEIWSIAQNSGELLHHRRLHTEVANFVISADGQYLLGANPYQGLVFQIELADGHECWRQEHLGETPAEIVLMEGVG